MPRGAQLSRALSFLICGSRGPFDAPGPSFPARFPHPDCQMLWEETRGMIYLL